MTPSTTGWTRHTAGGYYQGSFTAATILGSALARSGATFYRVGMVATHCPTCGTVAVYDGSILLGVVNLHATTRTLHVRPPSRPGRCRRRR